MSSELYDKTSRQPSVYIVDVSMPARARVIRTPAADDEPRDLVPAITRVTWAP